MIQWTKRRYGTGWSAIKGVFRADIDREGTGWWWRVLYRDDIIGSSGSARTVPEAKKNVEFEIARWARLLGP